MDARPIRTIAWDSPLIDANPGDQMPGHDDGHYVQSKDYTADRDEIWLTVRCSCGETFGGAFTSQQLRIASTSELSRFHASQAPVRGDVMPNAIEVEDRSPICFIVGGPPATGTCPGCGTDLDALARDGKVGHVCFDPDDVTNYDPAN